MMETAVDAPGEAPNNPAMDPSALETTSVPNSRMPPRGLDEPYKFLMPNIGRELTWSLRWATWAIKQRRR